MSDRNVIIAPSLKFHPHMYAFDIWMQQTFRRIDLGQLLIYFVDKVNVNALPILAQEFNLLGNKGWNFVTGETAQRTLLKKAVQIHRYMGTPWAIGQALLLIGITSGTLQEGIGTVGDGNDWLRFGVQIDTSVMVPTAIQISNATILINEWKNARSIFLGFTYL